MSSPKKTTFQDIQAVSVERGSEGGDEKYAVDGARPDPFEGNDLELKRRSVLAFKHGGTAKDVDAGKYPTNEMIIQALQLKVFKTVEVTQRYRRASAYKSGEVVNTLRDALMVDGQLSMVFKNEDEVLAYLGSKVLLPTWKDPVCGDGNCEFPWEFPAFGSFGCAPDCGLETNTTKIAINIRADFTGHPNILPRVLMSSVRWNLCLSDPDRAARGEADLCWYEKDQTFDEVKSNRIESAEVVDGVWYLVIKGDYTGRVTGTVYDLTNPSVPELIELEPKWEKCKLPLRKLLKAFKEERSAGNEDPHLLRKLRMEHFPDLKLPDRNGTAERSTERPAREQAPALDVEEAVQEISDE